MKRFTALLVIPFLLTVPVHASPLSVQNLNDDKDILAEVEEALSGGRDIQSEIEGALSEDRDIQSEVDEILSEGNDIRAEVEGALYEDYDLQAEIEDALSGSAEAEPAEASDTAWTLQDVRYQFEHSMLPRYFYDVPETMLEVIADPGIYTLWESVSTENGVDPTYSPEDYTVRWYTAADETVIAQAELPDPDENTLCFRIYFVYNGGNDSIGYYTVEYDNFFDETSFICTWDEDRTHSLLAEAEILDKTDDGYEEALLEEAELIAELAGVSTDLVPYSGAPETPDTPETPETSETPETPDTSGLAEISCPELGFSVMADPAYSWDYEEGTGISIYTESEGSIPYVIVFRSEDLIAEPFDFILEQYTPHIQEQYGNDLIGFNEIEDLEVGGKVLPAGVYTYRVQDYVVDMIRIYDSTGDRTVAYTAKFLDGEGDATLDALETAILTFNAD